MKEDDRLSTAALAVGSFMLWYLVKEPTMSHATSMCAVAAFIYAWDAARGRRKVGQWAALGLLGGLMLAIRWQNLVFLVFPAWELAAAVLAGPGPAEPRASALGGAIFAACTLVGFLPQLIAWNSIYGSPLAVSPLSPKMLWVSPDPVRLLWSSRNGLFATSPVAYLAALGLVAFAVRNSAFGIVVWLAAVSCTVQQTPAPAVVGPGAAIVLAAEQPYVRVTAGPVTGLVPERWRAIPLASDGHGEGFLASPHPRKWQTVDGAMPGVSASWVDATQIGVPSDLYYLAATGPLLSRLGSGPGCRTSLMISSTIGAILSATAGSIPLRINFSIVAAL